MKIKLSDDEDIITNSDKDKIVIRNVINYEY